MNCLVCQGTRLCPYCDGTGEIEVGPTLVRRCHRCKGTRMCPRCNPPTGRRAGGQTGR